MPLRQFHGRRAASIENSRLRLTVLEEGGHIAELLHKQSGVSPLWIPPWPSIEPSAFDGGSAAAYGGGADAKLLAAIMGHNWCLDIFGGPSPEEAAAGLTPHGEASVARYHLEVGESALSMGADLPFAQLSITRRLELHGGSVRIRETVTNVAGCDRPIAWTQHVTLGPPFLENGATEFRASATRSKVHESPFGVADYLRAGAEFDWPHAPLIEGGTVDLRVFTNRPASSAYTAHLMDVSLEHAYFLAFSPSAQLAFGYVWRRSEFPWLGIWEENHSRQAPPWNGATLTRGMEFGVSPMPETRRQMIDRGRMFDVPTYRWIPARSSASAEYWIVTQSAGEIPERLRWPL